MNTPTNNSSDESFEKFLQDSVAAEEQQNDVQKYHNALDKRFQDAMDQAGIQALTNCEPEKQNDLQDAAMSDMITYLLEKIEQPVDMSRDEFEELIRIRAITIVTNFTTQELLLITMIKISITSYEVDYLHDPSFDHEKHFNDKRALLAGLIASGDYAIVNDPWFSFANTIIPGNLVDFSLAENQGALIVAMEDYVRIEGEKERNGLLITKIKTMLESSEDSQESTLAIIRATFNVISIAMIERSEYQREERIREALRCIQVDAEKVASVLSLLSSKFPTK